MLVSNIDYSEEEKVRNLINYGLCDNYRLFTNKIKMHTFWHQWEGRHWSCGGLWSWDGVGAYWSTLGIHEVKTAALTSQCC